jgi:hypothetical protein
MTKKFKWGDEETPKENKNLERQSATEHDYDNYMTNKMNSAGRFEKLRLRTDVAERDNLKAHGLSLKYYKIGDEINWSTTLKN